MLAVLLDISVSILFWLCPSSIQWAMGTGLNAMSPLTLHIVGGFIEIVLTFAIVIKFFVPRFEASDWQFLQERTKLGPVAARMVFCTAMLVLIAQYSMFGALCITPAMLILLLAPKTKAM
jgi:hypothetical protein